MVCLSSLTRRSDQAACRTVLLAAVRLVGAHVMCVANSGACLTGSLLGAMCCSHNHVVCPGWRAGGHVCSQWSGSCSVHSHGGCWIGWEHGTTKAGGVDGGKAVRRMMSAVMPDVWRALRARGIATLQRLGTQTSTLNGCATSWTVQDGRRTGYMTTQSPCCWHAQLPMHAFSDAGVCCMFAAMHVFMAVTNTTQHVAVCATCSVSQRRTRGAVYEICCLLMFCQPALGMEAAGRQAMGHLQSGALQVSAADGLLLLLLQVGPVNMASQKAACQLSGGCLHGSMWMLHP